MSGPLEKQANEYAEDCVNDANIEMVWATTAFKRAEVYMKMLKTLPHANLRLTQHDDELYTKFRALFPDLDIVNLNEDTFKSAEAKTIWRPFLMSFEGKLTDFNQGTLLRLNSKGEYDETNTCIGK